MMLLLVTTLGPLLLCTIQLHFRRLQSVKGWNLTSGTGEDGVMVANPVKHKARDRLTQLKVTTRYGGGASNNLFYQAQQGHRSDSVLMDYGTGLETLNDGPVKAMVDQLANEFSAYSHSNYTESITASWVAKAKTLGMKTTAPYRSCSLQ